jgi:SAM-dependent methyltransferase
MDAESAAVESVNQAYYDALYRRRRSILGTLALLLHPLASFDQQSKSKRNYQLLEPLLRGGPLRILDYGFGHGSFLLKLPRACPAQGCDLSREAVHSLQHLCGLLGRRLELFTPDAFADRVPDRSLDVIVCSHVLEHVPDDGQLLAELASKLAPGGRLLLNLPINEVWEDPKHVRRYDHQTVSDLLARHGLRIEQLRACDRWTAFLLSHEQTHRFSGTLRPALRALRLGLALLPLSVLDALEGLLLAGRPPQQMLILARAR